MTAKPGPELGRILVVDDDESYSKALCTLLSRNGYGAESARSAKSAASLIGLHQYDMVLADICMGDGNGIQLLHGVRKFRPMLPVVLMTGNLNQATSEEATSMGAAGLLNKPFNSQALLSLIKSVVVPKLPGEAVDSQLSEFCEISIEDFVSGRQVDLDLYVRLGDGKFVKIAYAGEELPPERLQAYRSKNLEFLYVARADYEKYVLLQLKLARALSGRDSVPHEKKIRLIRHANEVIMQHLFLEGVKERSFAHARAMTEANLSVLARNESLFGLLEALNRNSDHLFAHALGVSVYASMLGRAIGWSSSTTLYKLCLGGLLHDIGLKDLPAEMLNKPPRNFSPEEVRLYQRHPLTGLDMLKGVPEIPSEILLIVAHHHENRTGSGYPAGLRESAIYPLAKVIHVVDEFCELTVRSPGVVPRKPAEAIEFLYSFKRPFLEPHILAALARLFGVSEPDSPTQGRKRRAS